MEAGSRQLDDQSLRFVDGCVRALDESTRPAGQTFDPTHIFRTTRRLTKDIMTLGILAWD